MQFFVNSILSLSNLLSKGVILLRCVFFNKCYFKCYTLVTYFFL